MAESEIAAASVNGLFRSDAKSTTMFELTRRDMRLLRTMTVLAGLVPGVASAQDYVPINPETVANYCYYGGMVYSVGARLCVPGTQGNSYTLVCKSATEDTDAAKTGRAAWRFDVGPPAPNCESRESR